MKKIMKKALSLMLVLAMVLVPMTAMAAAGDYVETPSWEYCIYSGDTVTVEANTTTYFEIGTEGASGTYDFVVEGTGAFDVAICEEGIANGYNDGYAEGTSVSAVNGRVETDITSYDSTYGYACFAITNNASESVNYTCTIVFPEGTRGNPKAVTLAVGGTAQVTVPAQAQYYVAATLPQMETDYQLTITGNTGFGYTGGYGVPNWDSNGTYTTTLAAYYGPASFAIVNNTASEQTYTLALDNMPIGSNVNPDANAVTIGTEITKAVDGAAYWYQWTPALDGTLTFVVDEEASSSDGWYICVDSPSVQKSNCWDDEATFSLNVTAEEPVVFGVSVPGLDYRGEPTPYEYGSGNVVFTLSFTEGTSGDGSGGDGDGSGSGGINEGGEEIDANYYYKYQELTVGTNDIMPMFGYPTTLYTFVPAETGEYLVTIDEQGATLGYYGSNEWFPYDYTETKTSSLTLEAEEANAPMLIGVSDAMIATVTITRVGDFEGEDGYDEIEYENVVTPEEFTFPGTAETLLDSYVDTTDDTVETAVLGDDGYYHLNSADGPVLFVNLSDELMNLMTAQSFGQLSAVNYDEGVAVSATDFNSAFEEYVACADVESVEGATLYPLTEDLMLMFKAIGEDKGWYGENGFVGGTEEDAWMFACYYDEAITSLALSTGGTTGGTTTDSSTSTSSPTTAPNTGDATCVALWAVVMMLGVATVATTVVTKKRER